MDAYDYDRQVWVEGEEAEALLAEQMRQHEELLASDPGYAAWVAAEVVRS